MLLNISYEAKGQRTEGYLLREMQIESQIFLTRSMTLAVVNASSKQRLKMALYLEMCSLSDSEYDYNYES